MPIVPISQRQAVNAGYKPAVMDAPQVNLAPLAQGMEQAAQLWQKTKDDADNAAAYQFSNKAKSQANNMLWSQDSGLITQRRGENAIGVADDGLKQLDAWFEAEKKSLKNPRQIELAEKLYANTREGMQSQLLRHQASEFESWQGDVYKNTYLSAKEGAASSYGDPLALDAGLKNLHGAVATQLQSQGRTGLIGDEIKRATGDYYASAVEGAIANKDIRAARMLLTTHNDAFNERQKARLDSILSPFETEQRGMTAAQSAIAAAGPEWSVKQVDDALVASLGGDPQALDHARKEVKYQRDITDQAAREHKTRLIAPVMSLLGDAKLAGRVVTRQQADQVLSGLRLASPEDYAKATASIDAHNDELRNERVAADERARAAHDRAMTNGAKGEEASAASWYTLKITPAALRVTDLMKLRTSGVLSEKHFNNLVEDQSSLRNKKLEDSSILSDKAAVDMVLNGAKIETTGKDIDPQKLGMFYERFNQRVREAGRPLNQQEKVDVARDLLGEVVKKREYWFDTTQKAFEIAVPPAERAAIIAALRRAGKPVTEANITTLYQSGQSK